VARYKVFVVFGGNKIVWSRAEAVRMLYYCRWQRTCAGFWWFDWKRL